MTDLHARFRCRYFKTLYIEIPKAEKRGASEDETQEIWDTRHEIGADRMMMLMNDLKGFFLKACWRWWRHTDFFVQGCHVACEP